MKLKKKIELTFVFIIFIIIFFATNSYAGTQSWNTLDYDVTLNPDGSMDVIETWDVSISETNTLFKSFNIGGENYNISNVKVSKIENGTETQLNDIQKQQYHVDPGCYYGLMIDSSTFEIAWHVGFDNSRGNGIYKMYYTVDNAVRIYNDCTQLYWQFLSKDNNMSGKNVTGRIRLPKEVSDIEKIRVWAHGSYSGNIVRDSKNLVTFSLDKLSSNEMLEVRVVTEENIYELCENNYNTNYLEKILKEEQIWADQANADREASRKVLSLMYLIGAILVVINIFILILFLSKNKKYKAIGQELKAKYSNVLKYDYEYFRDIPDEKNATPAKAVYMYNFKNNTSYIQDKISKIFSATMLNLSLKGLISFETVNEKEVRISKVTNAKAVKLSEDEEIIYDILNGALINKDSITAKEFSKYASKEYDIVYSKLNILGETVKDVLQKEEKMSQEKLDITKKWNSKFILFIVFAIFLFGVLMFLPAVPIGLFILAITCRKNANCISILTDAGREEVAMWKGLKKYMEDYSLLKDKLVPDIILWEKYLVYATAFGISKKVIEQLKVVHPEMFINTNDTAIKNYTYWNMMTNSSFGNNMFDDFSRGLEKVCSTAQSAYNAAHSSSSSGSGSGGGFSSGGGGRRRRWKLWWSINLNYSKNIFCF